MEPLQADAFGPKCLQRERDRQGVMATVGDEDCLTLNVWSPVAGQDDAPRPVLVFIHGGGNIVGSASEEVAPGAPLYDGAALAARGDAVVVTFQYRLGALGYLALDALSEESGRGVSGNYGSQDQVAALKWVQRNIAAFGGDPSRVMVFGESAGSVNTCVMVASPLARGLFHAALMQSGTCPSLPLADAEAQGEEALALTGCGDAEDALACLRALPARELVESIPVTIGIGAALEGGGGQTYGPVVDGWLLPRAPWAMIEDGEHNQVPVVIGSNADEMASTGINPLTIQTEAQYEQTLRALVGDVAAAQLLAAYPVEDYESPNDAFIQVTTDAIFTCPARTQVRILARGQEAPVYRYFFSRRPETPRNNGRASHGIELVYLFGAYDDIPLYNPAPADVALAGEMMEYWLRFAATGDPNGDGATAWPRFTAAADEHLLLDAPTSSAAGVRTSQCDLWDALLGQ
jgi:para-nitrobenzyl esterase